MHRNLQSVVAIDTKNHKIKTTLAATKQRRKTQTCKQYEVKIDKSHLNNQTLKQLDRLFLEAKWYYNSIIASNDIFNLPGGHYKTKQVQVKVGDHFEARNLTHISSQMKQELLDRTKDSIKALSTLKQNGQRVGALRFKSEVNSIPLKQYGNTWKIVDGKYIHIQGIEQQLKVRGLIQIPKAAETTSAVLLRKHGDYYLHITTYQEKERTQCAPQPTQTPTRIGIDLGIKNQITLSNGVRINYQVPVSKRMKRLARHLSRKQYRSHNWWKAKTKFEKKYDETTNTKKDIRNKLVHKLANTYNVICYQDDPIKAWQRIWGRRILNTSIGGITSALSQKAQTLIKVQRFNPTTRKCSQCGAVNKTGLDDRVYHCRQCELVLDRDLNAARNIEHEGVPTVRRELTPADTLANTLTEYFNGIPHVRASMVAETGSPTGQRVAASQRSEKPTTFSRG